MQCFYVSVVAALIAVVCCPEAHTNDKRSKSAEILQPEESDIFISTMPRTTISLPETHWKNGPQNLWEWYSRLSLHLRRRINGGCRQRLGLCSGKRWAPTVGNIGEQLLSFPRCGILYALNFFSPLQTSVKHRCQFVDSHVTCRLKVEVLTLQDPGHTLHMLGALIVDNGLEQLSVSGGDSPWKPVG